MTWDVLDELVAGLADRPGRELEERGPRAGLTLVVVALHRKAGGQEE